MTQNLQAEILQAENVAFLEAEIARQEERLARLEEQRDALLGQRQAAIAAAAPGAECPWWAR